MPCVVQYTPEPILYPIVCMSHSSTLMLPLPTSLSTGNNLFVLHICESTSFLLHLLAFYISHISDIIRYWSFSVSLIPLRIMLLHVAKFYSLLRQPEFLWWIFSWGVRALCSPKALFWKRHFMVGGAGVEKRVHNEWGLKYGNKSLFPWQPRETDPSGMKENHSSEEHVWDQLGFPQQNTLQKRKLSSLWSDAPCRGICHPGNVPSTPRDPQEGTFWPSEPWPSQGAWLMLTSLRPTPWLEDRHKATLFPGPDL